MLALAIAGDLGAHDTPCIGLRRRTSYPPDTAPADTLDRERAGAGAVVRADTGNDVERHGSPAYYGSPENIRMRPPGRYPARRCRSVSDPTRVSSTSLSQARYCES